MTIRPIEVQRVRYEIGKIRIGEKKVGSGGKSYPSSRDTFRFTSSDKAVLESLQSEYGGEVKVWEKSWELDSRANMIQALLSVEESVETYYEQWASDANSHRCNGEICKFTSEKGERIVGPCRCDPENRECKKTTRLSVILPYARKTAHWTLVSRGFYFPGELADFLERMRLFGASVVPVTIRIERREDKQRGGPAKRYVVPVVDVDGTPPDLPALLAGPILQAMASLKAAEQQIAALAAASAAEAPELPAYVDSETGEIIERLPATGAPALAPPAQEPATVSLDQAAKRVLTENGWDQLKFKSDLTRFKNACNIASPRLDWRALIVEGVDDLGFDSLDRLVALAESRDKREPRATGEAPTGDDPFEQQKGLSV